MQNYQEEDESHPIIGSDDTGNIKNTGTSELPAVEGINAEDYNAVENANIIESKEGVSNVQELKQKIADLKAELQMSPRQFEDKLLHKLREEIIFSKQKMQEQMQREMMLEQERLNLNPVSLHFF